MARIFEKNRNSGEFSLHPKNKSARRGVRRALETLSIQIHFQTPWLKEKVAVRQRTATW
jgi:hypothetical protein